MYTFSELLSFFVHQKDISVYPMTLYCGVDRTAMYKYLNGKACPEDQHTVERMTHFMQLSPVESEKLLSAWKIRNMDSHTWISRRNVKDFLLNFPDIVSSDSVSEAAIPKQADSKLHAVYPECRALFTSASLNNAVAQIILDEFQKKDGHLYLMLQPDYDYLFQFLRSFQYSCRVEHILCLGSSSSRPSEGSASLLSLKNLLPLYLGTEDYNIFYYYDAIESHFCNLNAFSCLILTSSCAITCTSDFQSGILYGNPEVIGLLTDYFCQNRKKCSPLFYPISSMTEICRLISSLTLKDSPHYILQPEPLIIPFLSPDLLQKMAAVNTSDQNFVFDALHQSTKKFLDTLIQKNTHIYHTCTGIHRFMETGSVSIIPSSLCKPFAPDDRKLLLYRFVQYAQAHVHLLRGPMEKLPLNFHLFINASAGYLMFTNRKGSMVYLHFHEPGLICAFMDYLQNLEETSFYSSAETRKILQSVLEEEYS